MKALISKLGDDFILDDINNCKIEIINAQIKISSARMDQTVKKKRGRPEEWTIQTALKECRQAKKARTDAVWET